MGILQRYLVFTMIKVTFSVFIIAIAVTLFVELTNEARDMGAGRYGLTQVLVYLLMIIPAEMYRLFPMLGLLGTLIGLGLLSSHNELLVMRASGLSVFAIMRAVFTAAVVISFLAFVVGEVFAPQLLYQAKNFKQAAVTGNQTVETERGVWMHVGNDFFNIARVMSRDHWIGVTRYHFDKNNQLVCAAWAKHVDYNADQHWVAFAVSETQLFDSHTQAKKYMTQIWPMPLTPSALAYGLNDAQEMSLFKLKQFIHYRLQAQLPLDRYLLDFWRRLLQPLAMLVMMMLAVPFVFVSSRSGVMGLRVLLGIMVSLGFYLISQLMGQSSIVFRLPTWLGAFLPIALFFILGVGLLRKVR